MSRWTHPAVLASIAGVAWAACFIAGSFALLCAVTRVHAPRPAANLAAPLPHESHDASLGPVAMPERIEFASPAPLGRVDEVDEAEAAAAEEEAYDARMRIAAREIQDFQEQVRSGFAQALRDAELQQEEPLPSSPALDSLRSQVRTAVEQAVRQAEAEARAREDL